MAVEAKELNPVSYTMLMTLAARAAADEIIPEAGFHDPWAALLLKKLPFNLNAFRDDRCFVRHVALRAQLMDRITADFFKRHPDAAGVGLGCGLCSRGRRILSVSGERGIEWFDVDLPEVIDLRQQYLPPLPGERLIAASVTDTAWLDAIGCHRPLFIVTEGVVSYLSAADNRTLFDFLGSRLGNTGARTGMVFDYIHPALVDGGAISHTAGGTNTPFQSGFCDADAVKRLHPSISVVSEHSFFSRLSAWHAMFEAEFKAVTLDQKPYNLMHIRFGSHG